MNTYEQKKQRKIERYTDLAEKAKNKSADLYRTAKSKASVIPFGQPILVGHHSESRDRNYRKNIHNTFSQSYKEQDKAEYYENKAKAVENNKAISSDDPEAIAKLKSKIEKMEKQRAQMTAINKAWRAYAKKQDKKPLNELNYSDEDILKLEKTIENSYSMDKIPFPTYMSSNLGQNIRAAKQRLEKLETRKNHTTQEKIIKGIKIVDNVEENRLQMFFAGKPEQSIRTELKRNGFRWSPRNGCWQAFINNRARYGAERVLNLID
jgi:hypothetical protein